MGMSAQCCSLEMQNSLWLPSPVSRRFAPLKIDGPGGGQGHKSPANCFEERAGYICEKLDGEMESVRAEQDRNLMPHLPVRFSSRRW
jgi:hypothetical protein